ncbi:MAG TPA: hypothetical protein VEI04_06170, partial [Syntrophobacteria bacterium]|nr:hypothetical protein [Syntrophobacteria bacterium]
GSKMSRGLNNFPDWPSDHPKNILLSPSGGEEDEGEGLKCGGHPRHPYPLRAGKASSPVVEREARKAVFEQPARWDFSHDDPREPH